jgi:hypothetical protein
MVTKKSQAKVLDLSEEQDDREEEGSDDEEEEGNETDDEGGEFASDEGEDKSESSVEGMCFTCL